MTEDQKDELLNWLRARHEDPDDTLLGGITTADGAVHISLGTLRAAARKACAR